MRSVVARALGAVVALACAASVAGCGTEELGPQVMRFKEYSYTALGTPEALAAQDFIKVTAVGTVEDFVEGVTYFAEPGGTPYPRVYLVVKVDKLLKGADEPRLLDGDRLYVDLDRGPINAADGKTPLISMADFRKAAPAGTRVALFLTEPAEIPGQIGMVGSTPPVRTLTPHPQGLIFDGGSGLVPGLITPDELPPSWHNIHTVDELAARMAS
ncbi:hypothetical protein [Actinokineospora sp. NPDC004072]